MKGLLVQFLRTLTASRRDLAPMSGMVPNADIAGDRAPDRVGVGEPSERE